MIQAAFQSVEMLKLESEDTKDHEDSGNLEQRVNPSLPKNASLDSENDRSLSQSSDDTSSQHKYVELEFKKR